MRFIEIKVINCIDPQNCLMNYLDPVALEQTQPGDANHKINLILPKSDLLSKNFDRPKIFSAEILSDKVMFNLMIVLKEVKWNGLTQLARTRLSINL